MRINLTDIWKKLLKLLRLSPLSLAKKCQLTFGVATVFTLALALLLPYVWMSQLTKKAYLDAERAKAETLVFRNHFQLRDSTEAPGGAPTQMTLVALDNTGKVMDANNPEVTWIPSKNSKISLEDLSLTGKQKDMVELLQTQESRTDAISFDRRGGVTHSSYVRMFRAMDNCISCHNEDGSASVFRPNQPIGAVLIERPVRQISKTIFLNWVWISVAGLIAGTGAIVAFYLITQRVILRPIRQLRAIANNVAEGSLDIRSAIKTGDEYENLANAFNNMLDALQAAQEKLRHANKQLDARIAELSERNIELFKANKVKGEFLANVSHEFRTPLNAILGFAQVLREKPGLLRKDKAQRYAENIITSGNRLLNMINDLLDLAKTQAGKIELRIQQTSMSDLCKGLLAQFSVLTKKKKIKVKLQVDSDIPTLVTDAGKVQQILYNFLSNAVKFTPQRGRIEIRANMLDEKIVRIAVSDTGSGIAEADREKIFEKFRQADGSLTRESTGTGLGLAISKELAAMLAGNIGMESQKDKGSTFWLDIPVTLTKDKMSDAPSSQRASTAAESNPLRQEAKANSIESYDRVQGRLE
jgi:two-component system sensor histidine kinase BarA